MANMLTRPIANATQRAAATSYLFGATGSGPATDLRFAATDIVMKDASGNANFANNVSIQFKNTSGTDLAMINFNGSNNFLYGPSGAFSGNHIWYSGGSEFMRLTSAGVLCVRCTGPIVSESVAFQQSGAATAPVMTLNHTAASGTRTMATFYVSAVGVGSISSNGTTTTYNTSSDYRLKNNIRDLSGSGEFIDALRPRAWDWSQDGTPGAGFVAHEFAEVSPSSVSGEKDAMQTRTVIDEETGEETTVTEPSYQAMQASGSEVIANIIAELQSLRARLAALEA